MCSPAAPAAGPRHIKILLLKTKLIINADDFGLSDTVNKAIDQCFVAGIINSTSLMVTTPGFAAAVQLAKQNGYAHQLGVHVNLTDGKPLTAFSASRFLDEKGNWNKTMIRKTRVRMAAAERKSFRDEIAAQVQRAEEAGIIPAHVNSHHHIHISPVLFTLFFDLCREKKYKLRIAQTHQNGHYIKDTYRRLINYRIRMAGLAFSDYFETIETYNKRKKIFKNGTVEIMVHPTLDSRGKLVDDLHRENEGREYLEFVDRFSIQATGIQRH